MFFVLKKIVFILKFAEILRGFPCSRSGLFVEDLLVCGVLSLSHRGTPHTIGAKRLNRGSFRPRVWSLTF